LLIAHQAEKRRETLVVGLTKTKDALSIAEDKYKNLQLELQRNQMDLLAKTSGLQAAAQMHLGKSAPSHCMPQFTKWLAVASKMHTCRTYTQCTTTLGHNSWQPGPGSLAPYLPSNKTVINIVKKYMCIC
jgi:hypothetical protein